MGIKEILLTEEEKKLLHKEYEETVSSAFVDGATKLAQLNLLKVLEEPCNYPLHIAYVGKHESKWSCPLCMQELKKDLGG